MEFGVAMEMPKNHWHTTVVPKFPGEINEQLLKVSAPYTLRLKDH